jgi:hypothetical protein
LEADPVAGAVRQFMTDRDEWMGNPTELWKALNRLVDEDVRHTKEWPGAANALTVRLMRLASALRDVGIEYSESSRVGKAGSRMKKLTKIKPAIVRQHHQPDEDDLQYPQVQADGPDKADDKAVSTDDTATEDRQPENRMGKRDQREADGANDSEDVLHPYSDQAEAADRS